MGAPKSISEVDTSATLESLYLSDLNTLVKELARDCRRISVKPPLKSNPESTLQVYSLMTRYST